MRGLLLGGAPLTAPSSTTGLAPPDPRTLASVPALLELALTTFGVVEVLLAGFAAAVAATQQVGKGQHVSCCWRAVGLQCRRRNEFHAQSGLR